MDATPACAPDAADTGPYDGKGGLDMAKDPATVRHGPGPLGIARPALRP